MVSEKFKTWWRKHDDVEKCKHIKDWAINTNNTHKKMVTAIHREMEFGFNRTGIRGGKFTTLNANSQNATTIYLNLIEELKYMVGSL